MDSPTETELQAERKTDRQIEAARASLVAHLGEIGRRVKAVRARLDVPSHIAAHPLAAVGAALALGALLGMRGGKRGSAGAGDEAASGIGKAALAGLAALGVRVAKELALRSAAEVGRRWWDQQQRVPASEVRTSYHRGVEPFLEH